MKHSTNEIQLLHIRLTSKCFYPNMSNLDNIALAFFSFIATWLTCCFQVKLSSVWILKYFTQWICFVEPFPFSLTFRSLSSYFLGEVICTSPGLSTLREISFGFNQFVMFLRSWLTCLLMDFTKLLKLRRLVSSVKWCTSKYLIATCKPFM